MLGTGGYALRLYALHIGACQFTGQNRIFREVFKVPAAEGMALDVERRSQNGVDSISAVFLPKRAPNFPHNVRVPGGAHCAAGGKGCGNSLVPSFRIRKGGAELFAHFSFVFIIGKF